MHCKSMVCLYLECCAQNFVPHHKKILRGVMWLTLLCIRNNYINWDVWKGDNGEEKGHLYVQSRKHFFPGNPEIPEDLDLSPYYTEALLHGSSEWSVVLFLTPGINTYCEVVWALYHCFLYRSAWPARTKWGTRTSRFSWWSWFARNRWTTSRKTWISWTTRTTGTARKARVTWTT